MRILWLKTELLHPVDKGGKIRSYHLLKQLKTNHKITYLTLDDGTAAPDAVESASEYCHDLIRVRHATREKFSAGFYAELAANMASPLPYAIRKYKSTPMMKAIEDATAKQNFDVVICDFLAPAVNLPAKLQTPVVLFQHNVEAEIWRRHHEVQTNAIKKRYLYWQWRKMQKFEREACRRMDRVIAVSEADSAMMERDYDLEKVYDIPTGVDVDFFKPTGKLSPQPNSLVFTGSMDWLPNEDGMQYFVKEILPLVRRKIPDLLLTIVGRNPYPSLIELGKQDAGVVVAGRVDDVRPYIERSAVFIVPLRIGGGTRLKIYEAMALERVVVSTTVGAEGLPLTPGKEIVIADTPETFAESVINLLTNPEIAEGIGREGATLVRQEFGWTRVAESFADLLKVSQNGHATLN